MLHVQSSDRFVSVFCVNEPVRFVGATLWRIWRLVSRCGSAFLYLRERSRIMTMSSDFASHLAVPLVNEDLEISCGK